ncbi:hypothetical protein SO802_021412 [Lithocarpus litseifolius]|uniref:Uncharacterized protein n=1 Tax=Lithocarpus litseifolius TaxID=425828 RepID=A0AAW2CEY5_9ROSI
MDDCLYNMGGLGFKTPIALPPKFKISDAETFDGIEDPKQHVRRIKYAINNGQLEKGKGKPPIKKTYGGEEANSKAPNLVNVSAIIRQQLLAYPGFIKKACREFSDLGMTLA